MGHVTEYSTTKLGSIFPNFQNCLHLAPNYVKLGLNWNCLLSGTDNLRGQLTEYIPGPIRGYSLMHGPRCKSWEGQYKLYKLTLVPDQEQFLLVHQDSQKPKYVCYSPPSPIPISYYKSYLSSRVGMTSIRQQVRHKPRRYYLLLSHLCHQYMIVWFYSLWHHSKICSPR